jgi:hypothetical protein
MLARPSLQGDDSTVKTLHVEVRPACRECTSQNQPQVRGTSRIEYRHPCCHEFMDDVMLNELVWYTMTSVACSCPAIMRQCPIPCGAGAGDNTALSHHTEASCRIVLRVDGGILKYCDTCVREPDGAL